MLPRPFALLVTLVCLAVAPLRAADVEFVRVWPGWRDAESFERISEYFDGRENPGRQTVLRTQPRAREGFYFLVRTKTAAALSGAKLELNIIRPDSPEPKTFSFPVTVPAKEAVFQVGLTGADWPGGKDANPVAWRLALVNAGGAVLAEHKSFMWEKPSK